MKRDDGEGGVRQEFRRPIGADGRTKRPRLRRSVRNPGIAALPFGLRIIDKPVGSVLEHIIYDRNFARDVRAIGTIVRKDQDAVGVSYVDKVRGELGKT